ncbi:IniB N-terminal domain-containing protein [Micromonospora sp. U21]|uniref:IniB N-terminal domain-containing protein n=1 Tax=Micromonospora sp. U21 TaxID=2824899 RepID=UPI001B38F9F1|nr:IniB N-terminal domain-containing protein [Micromonospora sp. U21]MBQ0903595.1 IniB N-terminal domain-containing protein [Micromonospora sp. U21]
MADYDRQPTARLRFNATHPHDRTPRVPLTDRAVCPYCSSGICGGVPDAPQPVFNQTCVHSGQTVHIEECLHVDTSQPVEPQPTQPVEPQPTQPVEPPSILPVGTPPCDGLHDFVLNLFVDVDARAAYDLDPEGALQAAGLTDVTAADVQDVMPLVADYALLGEVTAGTGLDGVSTDLTGALDLGDTLDADVVGVVGVVADPLVGDMTCTIGDPGGVLGGDGLLGGALSGVQGQVDIVGGLGVDSTLGGLGVDDTLGGLGLGDGHAGMVPVDLPSPVGAVTGQVDGLLSSTVGTVNGDAGAHHDASAVGNSPLMDSNALI